MASDFDDEENNLNEDFDLDDADSFDAIPTASDLEEIKNNNSIEESNTANVEKAAESIDSQMKDDEQIVNPIEYEVPPTENAGKQMTDTFEKIYTCNMELATLANKSIASVNELLALGTKKNEDIKITMGDYESVVAKLKNAVAETHKLTKVSEKIILQVANIESNFVTNYDAVTKGVVKAQKDQEKALSDAAKQIKKDINNLAKNVNVSPVVKVLEKEIGLAIKDSSIKSITKSIESFDKVYHDLEDISSKLNGSNIDSKDNKRVGLLEEFSEVVDGLDTKLYKIRKNFNWLGFGLCFCLGGTIFASLTYMLLNNQYQENFSKNVIEQTSDIHKLYKDQIDTLENSNKAYRSFSKKYGLDNKKYGFDYFEDSKEPYFYFPKKVEMFSTDSTNFIKIK